MSKSLYPTAGVVYTGRKFTAGVIDISGYMFPEVYIDRGDIIPTLFPVSAAPMVNLPLVVTLLQVSLAPLINNDSNIRLPTH